MKKEQIMECFDTFFEKYPEKRFIHKMIVDEVRAGFLSDSEILEVCEEYIEYNDSDDREQITDDELLEAIKLLRRRLQNTGDQEYFLRLDAVFDSLNRQGIVALHCAGYTQSDGFDDCNEIAEERHESGEKITGCCFYHMQDVEHLLHDESTWLYLSFGNYFDTPTDVEIGRMIVKELETAGFSVEWDGTAGTRIAVKDFIWDKVYSEGICTCDS